MSEPLSYMESVKQGTDYLSLLATPPLIVRYAAEEDLATLSEFNGILSRADWQELKRLVDRFYDHYTDDDIAELNAQSEKHRLHRQHLSAVKKAPQPGYVYLVKSGNGLFKIGYSKDVKSRLTQYRTHIPEGAELIHQINVSNMKQAESYLHTRFAAKRKKGEWFDLMPEDVAWICSLNTLELDR